MNEKRKCQKCGLLIDSDLTTCPYCGYKQEEIIEAEVKEDKKEENAEPVKPNFFRFTRQEIYLANFKNLGLFFFGFLGLQIISVILSLILNFSNTYLTLISNSGVALLNFGTYFVSFGGIILLINSNDIVKFIEGFKNKRSYLYGISYGLALVIISSFVSMLMYAIAQIDSVNNNEAGIDSITMGFPILSLIVFGFVGPIVEEITYRVGLFSAVTKKLGSLWGYILTAIIFGFLHFDFTALLSGNTQSIIIEFTNLPNYLVSGLLLCYFYQKEGFATATVAHIFNNTFSILMSMLASMLF